MMGKHFSRLSRIVLATAVIGTLIIIPGANVASSATGDNQCWNFKTSEKRFKRAINNSRLNLAGLNKLKLDPELSKVAKKQAKNMADAGEIFHSPSNRLRTRITNWTTIGENVGVGSKVPSLHQAFLDSAPHKANILGSDYRNIGISVVKRDGRMYVVMIFQGIGNPGTTFNMPSC